MPRLMQSFPIALASLVLTLGVWLGGRAIPAWSAPLCHSFEGQNLCVQSIRRSAKHPWEYWVRWSMPPQAPQRVTIDCRTPRGEKERWICDRFRR